MRLRFCYVGAGWAHSARPGARAQHYAFVMLRRPLWRAILLDWTSERQINKTMLHSRAFIPAAITAASDGTDLPQTILSAPLRKPLARCGAVVGRITRSLTQVTGGPFRLTAALGPGVVALGGCAAMGQEIKDFQSGWRTAEVVAVGRADQIVQKGYTDCRRNAERYELQASQYAALTYHLGTRQHWHIVKVSPGAEIAPGDRVRANVEQCNLPLYSLPQIQPRPL